MLALSRLDIGRGHAEVLAPQVQRLLSQTQTKPAQITKIAVTTGPGSFTGLRVGLSFAKGFALPRQTPVIGISVLEALARQADPMGRHCVASILDVRREQLFWQMFQNGLPLAEPKLDDMKYVQAATRHADIVVGNGAGKLGLEPDQLDICPAILAWLAKDVSTKTHPATPLYHRPPDAKLPGGKVLGV